MYANMNLLMIGGSFLMIYEQVYMSEIREWTGSN